MKVLEANSIQRDHLERLRILEIIGVAQKMSTRIPLCMTILLMKEGSFS